jgi:hypothetical protein
VSDCCRFLPLKHPSPQGRRAITKAKTKPKPKLGRKDRYPSDYGSRDQEEHDKEEARQKEERDKEEREQEERDKEEYEETAIKDKGARATARATAAADARGLDRQARNANSFGLAMPIIIHSKGRQAALKQNRLRNAFPRRRVEETINRISPFIVRDL